MQQLIAAWNDVDRKDKYEFRLRVAKRRPGDDAPSTPATPAKAEPVTAAAGSAAVQMDPQVLQ